MNTTTKTQTRPRSKHKLPEWNNDSIHHTSTVHFRNGICDMSVSLLVDSNAISWTYSISNEEEQRWRRTNNIHRECLGVLPRKNKMSRKERTINLFKEKHSITLQTHKCQLDLSTYLPLKGSKTHQNRGPPRDASPEHVWKSMFSILTIQWVKVTIINPLNC